MPASDSSAVIAALEPSDRSTSPKNPAAEKLAAPTDSNVGPSKGRKPAWNVPSGTASSESVGPFMGGATWPALGPATSSRASPKSTSTASSSSTDSLKSLSDGSAVSAPVETVMVPVPPPQQKPNPTPNLTRRASTGSESTHNPQPNNRSSRWGNGPNRRGNNNYNNHYNNNNNNGGGYRGRERVGANWNPSWNNNSPRPPNFYRGNQAMNTPPPPPPPVSYAYAAPTVHQPFYAPMGYVIAPQLVPQMAPPVLYSARELEQRDAILKQIEYYFSTENLCKDIFLRKNMDAEGWVPISFIANFNRVKQLTNNVQLIRDSLNNSNLVEVQGDRIRKRDNWMVWMLPPARQLENVAIQIQGLTIGPGTGTSSHNI